MERGAGCGAVTGTEMPPLPPMPPPPMAMTDVVRGGGGGAGFLPLGGYCIGTPMPIIKLLTEALDGVVTMTPPLPVSVTGVLEPDAGSAAEDDSDSDDADADDDGEGTERLRLSGRAADVPIDCGFSPGASSFLCSSFNSSHSPTGSSNSPLACRC